MGMNDGGVKRGDREETGDLEAQPTETVGRSGSNVGAGGGPEGFPTTPNRRGNDDMGDELNVRDEDDPSLGLGDGPEG